MRWLVLAAVVVLLAGVYVSWTAGRLDRLHARVDAAWAALDAQLVRRAAAARALAPRLPAGPAASLLDASGAALEAGDDTRETAENDLSRALRAVLPELPPDADLAELRSASTRVGLARSFHNAAVQDTRALRLRRMPRALRLAGHRALPTFFEIDDTALQEVARTGTGAAADRAGGTGSAVDGLDGTGPAADGTGAAADRAGGTGGTPAPADRRGGTGPAADPRTQARRP